MKSATGIAGALLIAALLAPTLADARGSSSHSTHAGSRAKAPAVPRDSPGRIARSSTARSEFRRSNPCPSTNKSSGACPGYVIDHVTPLKRGGTDSPSDME